MTLDTLAATGVVGRFPSRILLASLALLALAACTKDESPPPPTPAETRAEAGPFSPPEDGLLTEEQVRSFLLAHEALLRINDLYLDSLLSAPPARQRALQQALDLGRDVASRKFGLNGYAEYRWILEDAPRRPENVRMLERMKVTTVAP